MLPKFIPPLTYTSLHGCITPLIPFFVVWTNRHVINLFCIVLLYCISISIYTQHVTKVTLTLSISTLVRAVRADWCLQPLHTNDWLTLIVPQTNSLTIAVTVRWCWFSCCCRPAVEGVSWFWWVPMETMRQRWRFMMPVKHTALHVNFAWLLHTKDPTPRSRLSPNMRVCSPADAWYTRYVQIWTFGNRSPYICCINVFCPLHCFAICRNVIFPFPRLSDSKDAF